MSGNTLKEAATAAFNPIGTAAGDLFGSNTVLGQAGSGLLGAMEMGSQAANFTQGASVLGELSGTKLKAEKKAEGQKVKSAMEQKEDEALLGSARAAVDLMNPNSQQFTGQARTAAGQQELSRLLALFNQRQQDFAGSRARPGIQQTRLV